ncbi:MAG: adenylosuccinate lyase, partial [Rubricoccaceae bacterium]|nr:adenylosuccinate lyase [Rubricoccaceae bacterium]
LLNGLIEAGLTREDAYDRVQPRAMQAWAERRPFRDLVETDPAITEHLSPEQIADAFDPAFHMARVDEVFERVGLAE